MYGPVQIFDAYKSYLGQPVTEQTAVHIAAGLQQKYESDGYTKPGYQVLDRGIESGVIRIQLVEAQFSRIELTGDAGPYRERLQALVGGLPTSTNIRPSDVRDIVKRAQRFPGLDIDVSTEADPSRDGAYVLRVGSSYKPYQSSVTLSNRGTEEIGRELLFARLAGNGLFGMNNSTGVFAATAQDSQQYNSFGAFISAPVGSEGASMQLQVSSTSVQIKVGGIPLEQGRRLALLTATRPLESSSQREWSISGALEVDDLDIRQDNSISREDRLRSLTAGVRTTRRQGSQVGQWEFDIEQGLNVFGSQLETYSDTDDQRREDFTILRLHYLKFIRMSESWSLRSDGYAQYSAHILPSIKQFKVGGNRIGRGFEAAAVSGDKGLGMKLELKRNVQSPNWLRMSGIYGFYDLGAAWKNISSGGESAASAGIGITMNGNLLAGYLEIAKPLTHADVDGNKDAELFFELSFRF